MIIRVLYLEKESNEDLQAFVSSFFVDAFVSKYCK